MQEPAPALESAARAGPGWVYAYLCIQFLCQLALLPSFLAPGRILFRSAAFGTSLLFLVIVPGKAQTRHPVRHALAAVLAILALSALNPDGGAPLAIAASLAFHVSVVGPVFWVARLRCDATTLDRMLLALWAFATANAAVGVLQTYFPGQFQPNIGLLAFENGKRQLEGLMIQLSSGAWMPRPLGLTDTPGGAATGGLYATLLGMGVALRKPFPLSRPLAVASMIVGAMVLYLCQIRALIVMLGVCILAMVALMAITGRMSRVAVAIGASLVLALLAMDLALAVGGEAVTRRLQTLVASDAATVYSHTRGTFLSETLTVLLQQYPLGSGLGRWGMVNQYFGASERSLWVEIQWTAWLYDGGVALMFAYPCAIALVVWHAFQLAFRKTTPLLDNWVCVVGGYCVGAVALTFSYAIFMSASGIEFWLMNAVLIQAAAAESKLEGEGGTLGQASRAAPAL